jgi:hypothetical protein
MRPRGIVRLYEDGRLIWERANLFVNAGLPALANLIAGVTAGQYVTAMGFGSGTTPPAATDVGLTTTPTYYNAIGAHSFPNAGSVQFAYSLLTTDYGANAVTIQELGLFANNANVSLPSAQGTANPIWVATAVKSVGALVVDANGNIQRCTVSGTAGSSAPTWSTSLSGNTVDNTVTWTLVAFHQAPGPLIAHVTVPAFIYTGGGNYSGTWTLTF